MMTGSRDKPSGIENKKVEECPPSDQVRASLAVPIRLDDGRLVSLRLELLGPRPSGTSFADAGTLELEALAEGIIAACPTVKKILAPTTSSSPTSSPKSQPAKATLTPASSSKPIQDASQPTSQPSQSVQVASSTEDLKARDGTSLASIVKTKDGYIISVKVNVTESTGSWKNFLVGGSKRILPAVAEKHRGFSYAPIFEKGLLVRLELLGLDPDLWKELRSPITWALDRARETQQ